MWIGVLLHYVLDGVGSKRGIAPFYPLWSREFDGQTGVSTSSQYADLVTIGVTGLELLAGGTIVNRVDQVVMEYGRTIS